MMDSLSLAQIAAFAEGTLAAGDRDATVTRNVKHFAPTNAPVMNPWEYKPV